MGKRRERERSPVIKQQGEISNYKACGPHYLRGCFMGSKIRNLSTSLCLYRGKLDTLYGSGMIVYCMLTWTSRTTTLIQIWDPDLADAFLVPVWCAQCFHGIPSDWFWLLSMDFHFLNQLTFISFFTLKSLIILLLLLRNLSKSSNRGSADFNSNSQDLHK